MVKPNAENTVHKYQTMFNRRLEYGQCFHRPYMGQREFAVDFRPVISDEEPIDRSLNLGLMLYDIDYQDYIRNTPIFFEADMQRGIINTTPEDVLSKEKCQAIRSVTDEEQKDIDRKDIYDK